MKPISSAARTGVRPMRSASAVTASAASALVSSPGTTSTSRIRTGGLKKCMPQTRSGRSTSAAIAVTESEEVFVASTASGPQAAASRPKTSRFTASDSGAASTTNSQPDRSSSRGAASSRAEAASASSRVQRPRSAPFDEPGPQAFLAGAERIGIGVVQEGLVASEAGELGDPGAHRARPGDSDPSDRQGAVSAGLGSPSR